jgi:hypothetical protein
MKHIKQFPHCDSRILHEPGKCKYCDGHPDWQELREAWGINFTGNTLKNPKLMPCPAETQRPIEAINQWGGNVPMKHPLEPNGANLSKLLDDIDKDIEEQKKLSFNKATLSGKEPDLKYYEENGGAPQPLDSTGMHKDYWVLPDEDLKKGFVRPVRYSYKHLVCGSTTTMAKKIAETYAANPKYYGSTFCATCGAHYPVGEYGDFVWPDGSKVGT